MFSEIPDINIVRVTVSSN